MRLLQTKTAFAVRKSKSITASSVKSTEINSHILNYGKPEGLSSNYADKAAAYWAKIWKNKAKQLYQKAEILFPDDKIAKDSYSAIITEESRIRRAIRAKLGVLVAVLAAAVFAIVIFAEIKSSFRWPASGLAVQIPKPSSRKGNISFNDEEQFVVNVKLVSRDSYNNYIEACRQKGFVINDTLEKSEFSAFNETGTQLTLRYYSDDSLEIELKSPKRVEQDNVISDPEYGMGEIQWPKSEMVQRIPIPTSLYGRVGWEANDSYIVTLGRVSQQDYKEYVDACMDAGFNVDYYRGDIYFSAKDKDGYDLSVSYGEDGTMGIIIDEPKES